jgi:hypothetical protein
MRVSTAPSAAQSRLRDVNTEMREGAELRQAADEIETPEQVVPPYADVGRSTLQRLRRRFTDGIVRRSGRRHAPVCPIPANRDLISVLPTVTRELQ